MNRYLKRQHLLGVQDNQTTCLTSNTSTLQGNESSEVTKIDSPSTDSEMAENCSLVGGVEYEARLEAEVFTLSTEAEISQASRYWVPDAHSKDVVEHTIPLNNSKQIVDAAMQTMDCEYHCIGTQTSSELLCAQTQTNEINLEINAASSLLQCHPQFGFKCIEGNDEAIKYYTGITGCEVFNDVIVLIISSSPCLKLRRGLKLAEADHLLLALMKLRLICHIKDLAFQFNVAVSTVSDTFHKWLEAMSIHLKFLIKWPDQKTCYANTPQIFKDLYLKHAVSLTGQRYLLNVHLQEHRPTQITRSIHVVVIAITLNGRISFISQCWGGGGGGGGKGKSH